MDRHRRPAPWHATLLCLLVLALLLQGHGAALAALLGPLHHHHHHHRSTAAAAVPVSGGLAELHAWHARRLHDRPWLDRHGAGHPRVQAAAHPPTHHHRTARPPHPAAGAAPAADAHALAHRLGMVARHHHGVHADDAVLLGSRGGDGAGLADATAGSLLQPLGLAGRACWHAQQAAPRCWPVAATPRWRDHRPPRPERPPRCLA